MKIFLLLVLKCLAHSKISADQNQIHELQPRDIVSPETSLLEEVSKRINLRVKCDSSKNEFLAFEPDNLDRSPRRRKREVRNQNQIFFRRRKKKLYRQSKIRRSLLKRGKFTTATPYSHMKKYIRGKGKVVRPPGLKYRKRYRFNRFKKTQDVALGVGEGGRAKFKKSPPKKRAPIHVRDYERRQATRQALRGRAGERKSRDENDSFRKGADADRKRARIGGGNRATVEKSGKQYYDELSDYNSEMAKDSLPRQTKAKKAYSTFGRITKTYFWGNKTTHEKATKSGSKRSAIDESSGEDNTLLFSDEEQLTDVSSDISDLRSELSDERPKHRKNVSSSEYEQYSYAEDDSAIVSGGVIASKDESSPLKTTLLGPINYDQYDIKKLDASVERVFEKSKKSKGGLEYDDPFENVEEAYKDETSYESSSDTKQRKRKGRKSKPKLEKKPEKIKPRPKTVRELRAKSENKQTSGAKLEKDVPKSDSYDDAEDYDHKIKKQKKKQPQSKLEKDIEGSDSYEDAEEYESEDENEDYDSESKNKKEYDSEGKDKEEYDSEGKHEEEYNSEGGDDQENASDDEYTSDEEYSYEEPSTPKRRIPTRKMTQDPKQEKFYEEYTDTEYEAKNSKPGQNSKKDLKLISSKAPPSKKKPPTKKAHEKSIYEYEDNESEYSDSQSHNRKQKIKTTTKKSISKKSVTTKSGHMSDYESDSNSENYSETDKSSEHDPNKNNELSDYSDDKKVSKQTTKTTKQGSKSKKIKDKSTSYDEYEDYTSGSEEKDTKKPNEYEDYSSGAGSREKNSKKLKNTTTYDEYEKYTSDSENTFKEINEMSEDYESYYSEEKNEKKVSVRTTEKPLKKSQTRKNLKSEKATKISTNKLKEYNSENFNDESSHFEKATKKITKFISGHNSITPPQTTFKPLPVRITKSSEVVRFKSTLKPLPTTKKFPGKTSTKKSTPRKTLETYEESEYDSRVTSYEDSFENATDHKEDSVERITWSKEDLVERATWPQEDLKQSASLETVHHKTTMYDDSEEETDSAATDDESAGDLILHRHETESTNTTLFRKTKSELSTLKRTKKGFTTLPTTIKKFNSEEALKKISSKVAAITQKHVFVYNTKRKAYELVSLRPVSVTTLEIRSPSKDPTTSLQSTIVTSLYMSDNTTTSHPPEKTLKKRIVRKKTTTNVSINLPETTYQVSEDHLGRQSVLEDQTKKTTKKRGTRKITSARSNSTKKRSFGKTTSTGSLANEKTSS